MASFNWSPTALLFVLLCHSIRYETKRNTGSIKLAGVFKLSAFNELRKHVPILSQSANGTACIGTMINKVFSKSFDMSPDENRNKVFIGERGSWNRRDRIGYTIAAFRLNKNERDLFVACLFTDRYQTVAFFQLSFDSLSVPDEYTSFIFKTTCKNNSSS